MHLHHTPRPCSTCGAWPAWAQHLDAKLNHLENLMTEISANQQHLNDDVTALGTAFTTAIQELKDQIAAGATPEQLDFTAADALVAQVQAEATADAPPQPSTPVDTSSSDSSGDGSSSDQPTT